MTLYMYMYNYDFLQTQYGSSALHWVSSRGHIDMMEVLIQRDRNILNMQDNVSLDENVRIHVLPGVYI